MQKNIKCSLLALCCYYAHFSDLKELIKVKKGLTTSLRFYENTKNLGQSDDVKWRIKRGNGLNLNRIKPSSH